MTRIRKAMMARSGAPGARAGSQRVKATESISRKICGREGLVSKSVVAVGSMDRSMGVGPAFSAVFRDACE
jgi:hypothetical protein